MSECQFTLRRRVEQIYSICDDPLSRSARRSFAPLQKFGPKSPFLWVSRIPAVMVFVPAQKLSGILLSNDPGKKGSNFFCCGAIRFPHIEMFSFLRRECINLQKSSLRKKMYLNSTFKESIFVLKHFDQSQELQTIAKKCLQFYMIHTYDFCVT